MREPSWKSYVVANKYPILTPEQCNELIRIGKKEPSSSATIIGNISQEERDKKYRKTKISWIPFNKAQNTYKTIENWLERINVNYFDFDSPQLFEPGQYTEYLEGGFYDWHIDTFLKTSDMPPVRKISMTILLNDPKEFEGGELEIFNGFNLFNDTNKEGGFKLKQGQAIFFASFLLHRVKPIIKGNRKSLVMWFSGKPFK